ncbi:MAG: metal-dependent transcriptional regulator [Planctomycetes bacterium]|nr:metal-dependent transcriptional regulator [Planctomycetota bacterium]
MADNDTSKLSAALEDYLEAILNLSAERGVARSRGIADTLGVARSSVTRALRSLADRGLVNYEPYGIVTLTDDGLRIAETVARRHEIIQSFFVNVLGVEKDIAQKGACEAEHALGPAIIDRLMGFIEFVNDSHKNGDDLVGRFRQFCKNRPAAKDKTPSKATRRKATKTLAHAKPGQKVRLTSINAGQKLRSRLAALGLVPNVEITVVSTGRPGPFMINVKGSKIALGKPMVDKIIVE